MLRNYFDYVFLAPKAQGSIRSKLDPKPTRKARPDLRLWCMSFQDAPAFYVFNILLYYRNVYIIEYYRNVYLESAENIVYHRVH